MGLESKKAIKVRRVMDNLILKANTRRDQNMISGVSAGIVMTL